MNMRDQIDHEIFTAIERDGELDNVSDATGRILAIVRDALLSEVAVKLGARAVFCDPDFGTNTWTDDARNVLQAALAAAGLADTGKEQGDGLSEAARRVKAQTLNLDYSELAERIIANAKEPPANDE